MALRRVELESLQLLEGCCSFCSACCAQLSAHTWLGGAWTHRRFSAVQPAEVPLLRCNARAHAQLGAIRNDLAHLNSTNSRQPNVRL